LRIDCNDFVLGIFRHEKEKWGRQVSDPVPYRNHVEAPANQDPPYKDRQVEPEEDEANIDDEEIKRHWKKDNRQLTVTEERERKQK